MFATRRKTLFSTALFLVVIGAMIGVGFLPADKPVTAQAGFAPLNTLGPEIAKPGEVIIEVAPGASPQGADAAVQGALANAGVQGQSVEPLLDPNFYVVKVQQGSERIASANIASQPGVITATLNYARYIFSVPNDSSYPLQWNFPLINMPLAWNAAQSSDVIVAVLDTGLDMTHPEFRDHIVPGYDFVNDDADPTDDQGHGTHVAGIIAAASNNSQGIAGMSWKARIMPIKVADNKGRIYSDAWINGLAFARQHGAKVANMSFGGANISSAEQSAINKAYGAGMTLVAASGNCGAGSEGCPGTNPVLYPAAYDNVISVAAVGDDLTHAYYSESNRFVDLVAPGGDAKFANDSPDHWILSTFPLGMTSNYARGYGLQIGTSMAAPHVSGLAALMLSVYPGWTNAEIEQRLKNTAADLGTPGRDDEYGYGMINAAAAVANPPGVAQAPPTRDPVPPTITPRPTLAPPTASKTATTAPSATPFPTATSGPIQKVGIGCVFADVCQGDWFYAFVANLNRDGIMRGFTDNTFRPNDALTRGELAQLLTRASGQSGFNSPVAHFSDVPPTNALYPFVESVYANNIISGYRDGAFRPGASVSNGQLIKMVCLTENWDLAAPDQGNFADVPVGSVFYAFVETAWMHGIITPDYNGNFRPFDYATRAQAARIIDMARR